jgi:DNA polymerase III subunit gamma/tau
MSYLVLARKWRPQTFDRVIGQSHVTNTLQNAIRAERIAHAYLFTGARGVGKTSVARILAKTLNCEHGIAEAPCNECSNCREITQSHAVDVLEIDGASNRGIDSIRELRETVRFLPAKSRYRIYIIDEVHMLTTEAFNALLKTLEEPPAHVLFIFATTEPHKIPATILSRCQRFDFRRIPNHQIVAHLRQIAGEEHLNLSDSILYSIARETEGSMRDAQTLLEQVLAFHGEGALDPEILDLLGVIDRQSIQRAARAILAGDVPECLQVVQDIYSRGLEIKRFCHQLCEYFRNLLFVSLHNQAPEYLLDLPPEELDVLREQAENSSPESLHLYFQFILKGEEEIRRSSLPRIALEMLLLRLTQLPQLESLQSLLSKLDCLERQLGQAGASFVQAPPQEPLARRTVQAPARRPDAPGHGAGPAIAPEVGAEQRVAAAGPEQSAPRVFSGYLATPDEAAHNWPAFVLWLQGEEPLLAAKLVNSHATASSAQEKTLEITLSEVYEDALKEPKTLAGLREKTRAFFGAEFECKIGQRSKKTTGVKPHSQRMADSKRNHKLQILEHPMVRQALEVLGGELVDIRRLKPERGEPGADQVQAVSGESEETPARSE